MAPCMTSAAPVISFSVVFATPRKANYTIAVSIRCCRVLSTSSVFVFFAIIKIPWTIYIPKSPHPSEGVSENLNGQSTKLATVQQLNPIYVDATQSSNNFMRLTQSVEQGSLHKNSSTIELVTENGQVYPLKGTLQFYDVTVDKSTISITLRAIFPNPQHSLLLGIMFVHARIDEGV